VRRIVVGRIRRPPKERAARFEEVRRYHHAAPTIHGLWPEVGSYGTSQCVKPADFTDPTEVHGCYAADGGPDSAIISFETHEWDKHGECAGEFDFVFERPRRGPVRARLIRRPAL
jgi:ribonuclease I